MQPRKQHLIDTALMLFTENGYHATGIDLILSQAGVSKATLYKHFRSKDELILAALSQRHDSVLINMQNTIKKAKAEGACCISAIFDNLDEWFNSEHFYGCNFINASAEYNDPNDPIAIYTIEHKRMIVELIRDQFPVEDKNKADQIGLLIEGAIVMAHTQCIKNSALMAKEMAQVILQKS